LILPDTSAWIEWLRSTGSPTHRRHLEVLESNQRILTTGTILRTA
jgi:hypothetical protein